MAMGLARCKMERLIQMSGLTPKYTPIVALDLSLEMKNPYSPCSQLKSLTFNILIRTFKLFHKLLKELKTNPNYFLRLTEQL